MKIFLICPVRKAGDAVNERIAAYVAAGEQRGDQFHWPKRDTKQDGDPIGIRICRDNREAMFAADEIRVWYDPESRGSCFDIGMAFLFRHLYQKPVRIANLNETLVAPASPQLSLLIGAAGKFLDDRSVSRFEQRYKQYLPDDLWDHATHRGDTYILHTDPADTGALCMYGLIFASMRVKPARIVLNTPIEPTPEKSFNNLLLWLADETKDGPKTV